MDALRFVLRDETRVAHARLDEALITYDLSTVSGLTQYLSIHFLARQHLMTRFPGLEGLRDEAERLDDLSVDLSTLGAPLPSWKQAPEIKPKHPLGLIYVMAGSSLGSKLLYKNWDLTTDPLVRRASRFVTHAKNNDIWMRFLAYIGCNQFSAEETRDIITSANFCFAVFEAANNELKSKTP